MISSQTRNSPDIETALYLKIQQKSAPDCKKKAFDEIILLFNHFNQISKKPGNEILNSYTYKDLSDQTQKAKYETLVINLTRSIHVFGISEKFKKPKLEGLIEISSELIKHLIAPNQSLKKTTYHITSYLVKMTINHPPMCR